jgi:hypothetical protein
MDYLESQIGPYYYATTKNENNQNEGFSMTHAPCKEMGYLTTSLILCFSLKN